MPVMLTKAQSAYWNSFCQHTGYVGQPHDADMFGTPEIADELLMLVLSGRKKATCMLARWVAVGEIGLPVPGILSIVTDANERPACIIETTRVTVKPVNKVTAHFAWREGEGNRTVSDWLRMHRQFFRQEARHYGFAYQDTDLAIFEEFELLWC